MRKVREVLEAMTSIYDKKMPKEAIVLFLADLSSYSESQLLDSLKRCRSELKFFPSIAEIKERIDDGRPSPNEAWSKIIQDEKASFCWTEEMAEAYASASPLLHEADAVAARMAFLETYKKLILKARSNNIPVKWNLSLGYNRELREDAVIEAIKLKAISYEQGQSFLPMGISEDGKKLLQNLNIKLLEE